MNSKMRAKLSDTYLDGGRTRNCQTTQAEKGVVKQIFKCKDDSEMIAGLGCLMLHNECLEESEDLDMWMAFGGAVMLELGNRGYGYNG